VTRIRFYHNAANPFALTCELVRNAYRSGRRVAVRTPDRATAQQLDQLLWRFEALAFVPHVHVDDPLASQTPVLIGHAEESTDWPHDDLIFNLADDPPPGFERFRMMIEIIGQDERDKQPARQRWMLYRQQGHTLKAFDAVRREAL